EGKGKAGWGTQDEEQGENRNGSGRHGAMAMKFGREPIEDRVERDGNDDAPDDDRQKWSDQDQRPVAQKSKADYSNCQQQEVVIRCTELRRRMIVLHCWVLLNSRARTLSQCTR